MHWRATKWRKNNPVLRAVGSTLCLHKRRLLETGEASTINYIAKARRTTGINDATYYTWRKKFGGIARPKLTELKALEKENQRLKRIVAYCS